ncbi:DegV family protein [Alkalicoccus urumqiensis]|uniref:DegV family protein n=1 Tax=Alkalicoccus urumqiensis TaxID=1548213 RepID=A0A2P6MG52_ALKUR|nr:DegV family protein [Alkalicoccus urumqiensis]PRO65268.1 DegV family protein [Alkalicoccus urumqiensis]
MGRIVIVTDSTADIPEALANELGIKVVPLKVHFGEDTYEDGVDLTSSQFYEKLSASETIPTTSQPTPGQFEEVYQELNEDGVEQILSIHLSSKLSGTYQSAYIAQQTLGDSVPVEVIDSRRASYAIGIIAAEAARMAAQGESLESIRQRIDEMLEDTTVFFMVDTLEYLQKNGRIGKASALVGSLLKIKPILSLNEAGEVYPFEKVRGSRKAAEKIVSEFRNRFNGRPVHVGISHAQAPAEASAFMDRMKESFDVQQEVITDIGPVIGTHVGPGTVSISVAPAARKN